MYSMRKPIIFNTPHEFEEIVVYFANDVHRGSAEFSQRKWDAFEKMLEPKNAYVMFVGDQFENALRQSKSDSYSAMRPHEEKQWWINRLRPLAPKTICLIDGNHEARTTKDTDCYPLYDIALALGIEDRYRSEAAFVDIGVGRYRPSQDKQFRYVIYAVHKAQNGGSFGLADAVDNIDALVCGHTHRPMDKPLGKLCYDTKTKTISERTVENIVSGSFLSYGGYGARAGYRPTSQKLYKMVLDGKSKKITTIGFHL